MATPRATGRTETARAGLLDIRDPVAVGPLVDILGKKGDTSDRYLLVEVLENISDDSSTQGLLLVAFEDDFKKNRWRAIDALMARNSPPLVATVTARLKDKDNAKVRRAADILGEIGDDKVVPLLVDALVTTHVHAREITLQERAIAAQSTVVNTPKTIIRPDGVIIRPPVTSIGQATAQANPGGINVGQAPTHEVEIRQEKNVEVLAALTAITGEDFGYDKRRWLTWIREKHHNSAATIAP
ncbi:MAG: HEAT repeat domain-containing protein [Planctomycetota bacterium]